MFSFKDHLILFILLLAMSLPAIARFEKVEKIDNPEYFTPDSFSEVEMGAFEKSLNVSRVWVADWLSGTAEQIDLLLVGKKISTVVNRSYIRVQNSSFSTEGENFVNTTNLSVNLRLHNLEEFLHLKFATYDEIEAERGVNKGYLRQTPRERNYGTALGFFRRLGKVRAAFQPRIEFQNPLRVTHSLSFDSEYALGRYKLNPKLEFWANPNQGTGIFWSLNFARSLDEVYSLTFLNDGNYEEKSHLFTVTNGVVVDQKVNDRSGFSYSLLLNSNNRPNYNLDSYNVAVTYARALYKRIIDCQLTPHLDFIKEKNYKGNAGVTFNVNFNF